MSKQPVEPKLIMLTMTMIIIFVIFDFFRRHWSSEENDNSGSRLVVQSSTEHPIVEATIPLVSHNVRIQESPSCFVGHSTTITQRQNSRDNNNQESVLQKFRKSFSLRFNKKGSKESFEGSIVDAAGPTSNTEDTEPNDDDDDREPPPPAPQQINMQHKDDTITDQKFR